MSFQKIAMRFEQAESGTDSFKLLYRDCYQLMKNDPDNASLYFVVAVAAQAYVRGYEDQGVSSEFADHAKAILVGYNARLVNVLDADPATRLRVLGQIAIDYEWEVHDF